LSSNPILCPAYCLKACFINAASWFKIGKQGMKPLIAGCTKIEPYDLVLTNGTSKALKKYEIDLRPVVVQRARIMRARPRLDNWTLNFEIVYNEQIFSTTDSLEKMKMILEEAGQRIGLLDNRPQKYGDNGCFKVTKWKAQ